MNMQSVSRMSYEASALHHLLYCIDMVMSTTYHGNDFMLDMDLDSVKYAMMAVCRAYNW